MYERYVEVNVSGLAVYEISEAVNVNGLCIWLPVQSELEPTGPRTDQFGRLQLHGGV